MDEFVEQFLIESRELVEQATDDLLTLEGRPEDKERLDSAFRAFHTLKGAAGIVDFDAMGRALHAAEDVLAAARAGHEPVAAALIGDCLSCLDQVVQWLDAMEATGEPPSAADAAADALVRRFGRAAAPAAPPSPTTGWASTLAARHGAASGVAVRYRPLADAFFRGEDPLALLGGLPGLIALEIETPPVWPPLADFDPFACDLAFQAVADCTADQAGEAFAAAGGQIEIVVIGNGAETRSEGRDLLEAQLLLLDVPEPEGLLGRLSSAGRVACNVLRHQGRGPVAERLNLILLQSQTARDPAPLAAAIRAVVAGALGPDAADPEDPEAEGPKEVAARTLRVDVERIDALVNLTGELLVSKNALGHATAVAQAAATGGEADPTLLAALLKQQHATLQRLVDELQHSVLGIRVLPMRYVFQRFPRLIREMVVDLGKPAHLVTEGDDTEADKTIVEGLFEPLLHILRNALDHGVEPTEVRQAAGKPASATVTLRAGRQGDQVVIEVEDDGSGIDIARVRRVAEERGVASPEALDGMDDQQIVDLVFAPGFSTAATVTSLSGRGVGMDAVRSTVERLGGRVTIESQAGKGTIVRLTLPFAVMMSRVLTVEAGGQMFGVPLDAVLETARIDRRRIKPIGAAQAFVFRDRTVPVIDLARALGRSDATPRSGEANVVVAVAGGHIGAVEVDRLGERLDVMLKPMEGLLAGVAGLAGTTLLGDGRVLIVLDLQELLQ